MNLSELRLFAANIRLNTVKCVAKRGFGHLGGALSVADVLAVLYGGEMRIDPKNPGWDERDLFVCSKGHAGPAVYATLALKGYFPMSELETLNRPGTNLPSHCDKNKTPGVDMTTGSLGQGISIACGMALGVYGTGRRVFCIVGDGECDEGQVWEAVEFAAHHKLDNFFIFVDLNKKQLDGYTHDIIDLRNMEAKLREFGCDAVTVDGRDVSAIAGAIKAAQPGRPHAIVLDTVKGAGVPEIEQMVSNHHIVVSEELAARSIAHLEGELARLKGDN